MDTVSPKKRSKIMQAVRSKDTKIEIKFRKKLWQSGFHYRKHPVGYLGKPDLINRSKRTVVFIDSCFWHGCSKHCRLPGSNRSYWIEKINRNKTRDKKVNRYYRENGWKIYRFWEHENLSDIIIY